MASTSEDSYEPLRENLRSQRRSIRRSSRVALLEERRGVSAEQLEVSPGEVRALALTLRKRGAIDTYVLVRLQASFLLGPEQVSAFMSTDGALSALVKALTGLNPTLELKAAYCLCNLALAGGKTALKISKLSASYLLIHLDGMNSLLQDACAWTVGNLASVGGPSWNILHTQGALPRLINLLKSPHRDVVVASIYSLTHFLAAGRQHLKPEELQSIATAVMPHVQSYEVGRLIFLLSCSSCCDTFLVPDQLVMKLSRVLTSRDLGDCSNLKENTFLLRSVANVCVASHSNAQLVIISLVNCPEVLKILLSSYPHLKQETLWLLANLFKNENEQVRDLALSLLLPVFDSYLD